MATVNINVRTDAEVKAQAQQIFESIGLDLSTAVNLFLKQTVRANHLPFVVGNIVCVFCGKSYRRTRFTLRRLERKVFSA
ncbi:MAG: type II toxin-antitoxin system RelB/DinJ family antitoxin [Clostridium sp.]|jgi:hypothetical protein|nr:type II toxin-antitoxin system RelB/DinJ family antitoxin [Clostridium sp.]